MGDYNILLCVGSEGLQYNICMYGDEMREDEKTSLQQCSEHIQPVGNERRGSQAEDVMYYSDRQKKGYNNTIM